MDGEIVNLPNQKSPQEPIGPSLKKRNIAGAEIIIIVILLILTAVILNYFNVLPISNLWHKRSQQSNNATIAPPVRQSFPTFPPSSFNETAKQTLANILPTILTSSLLPQSSSNINLREDKGIKQSVSGHWDFKDGKAITILTASPNGKEISQLLIFFPYATTASVSAEFAQSTIPKLFSITPKGKWGCKTVNNSYNYCENFWEDPSGIREGIALKQYFPLSQAKKITISFCEHNKDSRLYSWKSCTSEFAETGVQ